MLFCLFLFLGTGQGHAQIASPCDANPFCSDSSYTFPNTISGHIPNTVDSGCLGSAPAPIWYWMQIGTAGTMQLTLSQTNSLGTGILPAPHRYSVVIAPALPKPSDWVCQAALVPGLPRLRLLQ